VRRDTAAELVRALSTLFACARERLWNNSLYRRLVSSRYVALIPLATLLFLAIVAGRVPVAYDAIGIPILNVGVVLMLDRYMRFPDTTWTGRWLNWAPIAWVGTISYSLYLWQEPMTSLTVQVPVIVKLLGALALAIASRYWIELPFLALRRRLMARPPPLVASDNPVG
jgi:peptidoglycan/LPS O-acetylase OafA/YrhL